MEIGADAVPAALLRRAAPWRKGGTALSGPDVAACVGGRQRLVFPPPPGCLTHKKALLSFLLLTLREDSIKKKGAPDLCLKGAIFYLMLPHFVKISLDRRS
jgi:hypothetical protein